MPLFDQERMVKLVSEHRKSIARLHALSKIGREAFLIDPDKIASAKYHFKKFLDSMAKFLRWEDHKSSEL